METSTLDSGLMKEKPFLTEANIASGGKRFGNYILDRIFIQVMYYGLMFLIPSLYELGTFSDVIPVGMFILTLLIGPAYYILMEYYTGKTLGKMITRTKVVTADGERPSLKVIILRTLCRIIPFDAFSFLGTPAVGWHDSLASSRVVYDN